VVVERSSVEVAVGDRSMRCLLATPRGDGGPWPGVVFFSDIFQLTEPTVRWCVRLAGYGFAVLAPEIYHRLEPAGTVLGFDDEGKARGQRDAETTAVADFDADAAGALAFLADHPAVAAGHGLGVAGHCTGGHLAFRAAFADSVAATACWYPTGLHDGKLGADPDAGSLAHAGEIGGELLMVFGSEDPHTPQAGRAAIHEGIKRSGARFDWRVLEAAHAFGRDVGERYDPVATDVAFAQTVALFRRRLSTRESATNRDMIEFLWAWLDAVRRRDEEAVAAGLDAEVVWQGLREHLVCRGAAEVAAMFVAGYAAREEIASVEVVGGDGHVVLGVHAADLGEVDGIRIGAELYNVFTVENGRITRVEDHLLREGALAAAGLNQAA